MDTLDRFELALESTLDLESAEFRRALCILDSEATQPMPGDVDPLIRPMPRKLCHLLCLYRLVDVLYDIRSPDSIFRNPRYSRMGSVGFSSKVVSLPPFVSAARSPFRFGPCQIGSQTSKTGGHTRPPGRI